MKTRLYSFLSQTSLKVVVCLLLLSGASFFVRAQETAYRFYFPQGHAVIDSTYMSNSATMAQFRELLRTTDLSNLESVVIEAGSSPEGGEALNNRLAVARGEALGAFLQKILPDLSDSKVTVRYNGEDWAGLRFAVEKDHDLDPKLRSRILEILDGKLSVKAKKSRLQALSGYKRVADKYYPELRYAFLYLSYGVPAPELPDLDYEINLVEEDLLIPVLRPLEVNTPVVPLEPYRYFNKPILAVSTNVLYDLAITPNVALEIPVGKHWSLWTEYTFPWWVTKGNDRAWEILKWDVGVRYWLQGGRSKDPMDILKGHYIGLDLSGGYYDIEPHHKGWQGEFQLAGLEYGYAWALGKAWRLDAYLGLGWMGSRYRYYEAMEEDTHLLYQHSAKLNWFGPVKAGVSIKYIFNYRTAGRKK